MKSPRLDGENGGSAALGAGQSQTVKSGHHSQHPTLALAKDAGGIVRATTTTIQSAFRVMVTLSSIPDACPNGFPFPCLATSRIGPLPQKVTPSYEGEQAPVRAAGYKTAK